MKQEMPTSEEVPKMEPPYTFEKSPDARAFPFSDFAFTRDEKFAKSWGILKFQVV
jgi:hypothetical protein